MEESGGGVKKEGKEGGRGAASTPQHCHMPTLCRCRGPGCLANPLLPHCHGLASAPAAAAPIPTGWPCAMETEHTGQAAAPPSSCRHNCRAIGSSAYSASFECPTSSTPLPVAPTPWLQSEQRSSIGAGLWGRQKQWCSFGWRGEAAARVVLGRGGAMAAMFICQWKFIPQIKRQESGRLL